LKNEGHFETEEMKNTDLPNLRISIKKSKYKNTMTGCQIGTKE
jgi:hypothetical protein